MKNLIFAGLLIVSGAILVAATEIANGSIGMFLGIQLIAWGIAERIVIFLQNKKQK